MNTRKPPQQTSADKPPARPRRSAQPVKETIGYVGGFGGRLTGPGGRPFYQVRIRSAQVAELLKHLDNCAACADRSWFNLCATYDEPDRLRLTRDLETPAYEGQAAPIYLRGDVFRISGQEKSCNIDFSGPIGAALLAERLRAAQALMRDFMEIRVPNRKRQLVEFVPDVDLEAAQTPEHKKLALTGEALAGDLLAGDEFADWGSQDV